jgi:hypothetical protein
MTHHPPILLTLHNLEQIADVSVEIKDLRAKQEIRITQEIQLFVLLDILSGKYEKHFTNRIRLNRRHLLTSL